VQASSGGAAVAGPLLGGRCAGASSPGGHRADPVLSMCALVGRPSRGPARGCRRAHALDLLHRREGIENREQNDRGEG
jgi:hypothetical protein